MASNVVPTRIVNKLGISTTVYKSVDKSSSPGSSAIPAPAVQGGFKKPEPTGDREVDDFNMYLYYRVLNASKSDRVKARLMATLNPQTSAIIVRALGGNNPQAALAAEWSITNRSFALLNGLAVVVQGDDRAGAFHLQAVNGISLYPRPDNAHPLDLSQMSESEAAPYLAVIKAVETVTGTAIIAASGPHITGTAVRFQDDELAAFVMRNHDRLDAVIELIQNSKRDFDAELFQRMLDSPAQAMREGEL